MMFAAEIADPYLGVVAAGVLSWMAYMAKQITSQSNLNATTAAVLAEVVKDVGELKDDHHALDRRFIDHIEASKDRKIRELEMQLAQAKGLEAS